MRKYNLFILTILLILFFGTVQAEEEKTSARFETTPITPAEQKAIDRGLEWLTQQQSRAGRWSENGRYPVAMTSLAGIALCCEGSTTTQGKYSVNIRRAVDYLTAQSNPNGLIGTPMDDHYIYGHGFAMLFLSQVLGEEEDAERREILIDVLTKAVIFSGQAQTKDGGWGYVSAKEGRDFDEGSTTITQMQGLRGCRNAGIPVPKEIIDKAVAYIHKCTGTDGGVIYSLSSGGGGGRPAITAAAVACLFNAGEYDDSCVPKQMEYCKKSLDSLANSGMGYWHYAHYYYAQVKYRIGGEEWGEYRKKISKRIISEAESNGSWNQGFNGPVFTTSVNLTILQLEKSLLPIYQR